MLKVLIEDPILNILSLFYTYSFSLGISIILLTLLIKMVLYPFMVPTFKNMQKQKALKPQLDALKEKYGQDKKKLSEEQMKLFKEHGINPASGCLTQLVTIFVLIGLYQVIQRFTNITSLDQLNSDIYFTFMKFENVSIAESFKFLIFDLKTPDHTYILPIIAGLATLVTSVMMLPEVSLEEKAVKKVSNDPMEEMAYTMQTQMTILAPIMTFFVGLQIPAGLTLYIAVSSLISIVQQYYLLGSFGGLISYSKLAKRKIMALKK
jgi:YidC/Oxa1 family membrane protein insertase